jgi:hypothetical protein
LVLRMSTRKVIYGVCIQTLEAIPNGPCARVGVAGMVRIGELVIKRVVQISPLHGIAQNHRESAKIVNPELACAFGTCPTLTTS